MSSCSPIPASHVSVSNKTIESTILHGKILPDGICAQPMPTVGRTMITPVSPLLNLTFRVRIYINNYQNCDMLFSIF